jgi:hypothetical protein
MTAPHSIYNSKVISRFAKLYAAKYSIPEDIMADLDKCVLCALENFNFFHQGCAEGPFTEFEFNIKGKNFHLKGFIDDFAIYEKDGVKRGLIRDYKTTSTTYNPEVKLIEDFTIQSDIYQYAIWKQNGILSDATFIMLRYPPTKKKPTQHYRNLVSRTEEELKGLEFYLEYMGEYFNNFGIQEAMSNFCCNRTEKDKRFCEYVCKFKEPLDYILHIGADGAAIKGYFLNETLPTLKQGEKFEVRHYKGCPGFGAEI